MLLLVGPALAAGLSGCGGSARAVTNSAGGSNASYPGESSTPPTSYAPRISLATFQDRSASYFPDLSSAQRLVLAQRVCASIRAHGDNFMSWLVAVNHDHSLFPYELAPPQVGAFAGLAVSYVCDNPAYLAELRQGLAGLPTGSSLGTSNR